MKTEYNADWIRSNWDAFSTIKECYEAYVNRFGKTFSYRTMRRIAKELQLPNKVEKKYRAEPITWHDDWIRKHYNQYATTKECLADYRKMFGDDIPERTFHRHMHRVEGITPKSNRLDVEWHTGWILDNYKNYKNFYECCNDYNKVFGEEIPNSVFKSYCARQGLRIGYSDEELEWITENYPTMGYGIVDEYEKRYGKRRPFVDQVARNRGVKVNFDTLSKTHSHERVREGEISYRKNQPPVIKVDGKLVSLSRYVCETNGINIPEDCNVIHLDNNTNNCSLENLRVVSKSMQGVMNAYNMFSTSPTLTQMGVEWCKLRECLINNGVNVSKLLKEE